MLHEERLTYETLKMWALDCYYEGCRDHAATKGWSHEQIMAYVDYQFEHSFERPVEQLMWRVILLVMSGGWNKVWCFSAREIIVEQLKENSIESILFGIPLGEAELFMHDLRVLRLI